MLLVKSCLTRDGTINSNMQARALTMVGCGRGGQGTYQAVSPAEIGIEGQHDAAQPAVAVVPCLHGGARREAEGGGAGTLGVWWVLGREIHLSGPSRMEI